MTYIDRNGETITDVPTKEVTSDLERKVKTINPKEAIKKGLEKIDEHNTRYDLKNKHKGKVTGNAKFDDLNYGKSNEQRFNNKKYFKILMNLDAGTIKSGALSQEQKVEYLKAYVDLTHGQRAQIIAKHPSMSSFYDNIKTNKVLAAYARKKGYVHSTKNK